MRFHTVILTNPDRFNQAPADPPRPQAHSPSGTAGERLALLRLRDSKDPIARAIALFGCQLLRKLDAVQGTSE